MPNLFSPPDKPKGPPPPPSLREIEDKKLARARAQSSSKRSRGLRGSQGTILSGDQTEVLG